MGKGSHARDSARREATRDEIAQSFARTFYHEPDPDSESAKGSDQNDNAEK